LPHELTDKLIAGTPGNSAWGIYVVPVITVLLVATGVVYVFVDPAKLIQTLKTRYAMEYLSFGLAWYMELHAATRVYLRDDDTLVFEGLFRQWQLLPSAISKFMVLGGFVVVRHTNGFVLLPTSIANGDTLIRWVTEYRKRHGFDS